jgi:hypothetical protein
MDNKTIQKPEYSIDRMVQLAGLPTYNSELEDFIDILAEAKAKIHLIKNGGDPNLLNEGIIDSFKGLFKKAIQQDPDQKQEIEKGLEVLKDNGEDPEEFVSDITSLESLIAKFPNYERSIAILASLPPDALQEAEADIVQSPTIPKGLKIGSKFKYTGESNPEATWNKSFIFNDDTGKDEGLVKNQTYIVVRPPEEIEGEPYLANYTYLQSIEKQVGTGYIVKFREKLSAFFKKHPIVKILGTVGFALTGIFGALAPSVANIIDSSGGPSSHILNPNAQQVGSDPGVPLDTDTDTGNADAGHQGGQKSGNIKPVDIKSAGGLEKFTKDYQDLTNTKVKNVATAATFKVGSHELPSDQFEWSVDQEVKSVSTTIDKAIKDGAKSITFDGIIHGDISSNPGGEDNLDNDGSNNLDKNRLEVGIKIHADAVKKIQSKYKGKIDVKFNTFKQQVGKLDSQDEHKPTNSTADQSTSVEMTGKTDSGEVIIVNYLPLVEPDQINPAPSVEKPGATEPTGKSDERPTGKSDEKPTNRSDRKPTPRPTGDETPTGPAPAGEQESSQRNTQLGVLLKAINKNADAFTQLEVPYNTRLTQSIFNKAQSQQAKNLTALITAIRKNPDYFLSKVSKLTGTQLAQRDKVTNRFAKAPVAEGLLLENQIDDLLKQVGITDELIKQKGKAIVDYLTKIYKLSTTNTAATNQPEVPKDTQNVLKQIDSNAALKQSLVNINTVDELINILSSTMQYVDKGYAKNTSDIATAARDGARVTKDQPPANRSNINTTGGQTSVNYKVVEAEMPTPPDALKTVGLIGKYPSLLNMLKNINNRVELVPLWIGIISRVNPTLSQDGTSVNRVWQKLLTLVQKPPTQ